ncbi:MAG: hypothetical protein K8R41_03600 [Bacteroidales bacterium]|nr:hypothetical protein [Bacteroidales bacterium]
MIEKNRDILKKVLNDLPKRKAANSNWNDISGSLDHLETKQFISQNASSLPKYKAPSNAWQGIEKGLKKPWFSFASNGFVKIGAIAIALFVSLVLFLPDENNETKNNSEAALLKSNENIQLNNNPDKEIEKLKSDYTIPDKENINKEKIIADIIVKKSIPQSDNKFIILTENKKDRKLYNQSLTDKNKRKNNPSPILRKNVRRNTLQTHKLKRIKSKKGIIRNFGLSSTLSIKNKNKSGKPFLWDYYRKKSAKDFYLGGYYSLINYQNVTVEEMEIPESISSFGLEFITEKRKLFFKTAISYLSWKEKAKYTFMYNQNEYILSYNYVDSAFMNLANGNIEYYTSLKDVFDSVAHQKPDEIKYKYQLLQIPLIIGYKIIENQNFIISLNGGLGFDIRIGGQEYLPVFNEEQSNITGTINYMDYRLDLNCRFISGISAYYRLSNKFSFYLEPSYQQYLKSVYKNTRLKDVSYFEIKTGLVYKF